MGKEAGDEYGGGGGGGGVTQREGKCVCVCRGEVLESRVSYSTFQKAEPAPHPLISSGHRAYCHCSAAIIITNDVLNSTLLCPDQ